MLQRCRLKEPSIHSFIFQRIARFRQNYWFWPSAMTFFAVVLGFALPAIDGWIGAEWTTSVGFVRATQVEGARAILTTLAGATLGVAGVAFSITIVAVSFASSNYGPRLIGNFMGDRTNQLVLGVFVATFVYCIIVLSTVHARLKLSGDTLDAFVPQLSVLFAIILTLASVGALIGYIHHIPESINIMNLAAKIGTKLRSSVITMLENEDTWDQENDAPIDVSAWRSKGEPGEDVSILRTESVGYLQQLDLETLNAVARQKGVQITVNRAPGDFLAAQEMVMTVRPARLVDDDAAARLSAAYTLGSSRTDYQDVLFLSDQLVEVLVRALSPGINDPQTAMLCLDWLRAGLAAFARRSPSQPATQDDRVRYTRVTFETMLDRSFDRIRQCVSADTTVTLHALGILADISIVASRDAMVEACKRQMERLAKSASECLDETLAREEVRAAFIDALHQVEDRRFLELGEGSVRKA